MFDPASRLCDTPIVFIDVETTGASTDYGDRITEFAALRVLNGDVVDAFDQLVNPQRRISSGASRVTGITDDIVANCPTFDSIMDRVLELMDGAIIVGHNIPFDLAFLHGEFKRYKMDYLQKLGDLPVIDTVRIARKRLGRGGNGLQNLSRRLGISPSGAHRALVDCETTFAVLRELLQPVGGFNLTIPQAHQLQGTTMSLEKSARPRSSLPSEISRAIITRQAVSMVYVDSTNIQTTRAITPITIRKVNGVQTLIAHCHLRDETRMFKLDRILSIEIIPSDILQP